tara:strand:+ start:1564 stop:2139 length:576 start_codon:yes stop_codon:yes gene_type:complete
MRVKILTQLFLFLVILLISFVVYKNYFKNNEISSKNYIDEKTSNYEGNNIIKELEYESFDEQGRKYVIKSNESIIDEDNPEIIFMKYVNAKIVLTDNTTIFIYSDKAKYNNKSFNTNFEKNVKLNFLDHDLSSENLDLFFDKNKIEVYNNLIYKNLDLTMTADKIEIDMLTKYSKIFNYDKSKVKIQKIIN